jgi:hypothetical protein
MPASHQRDFRNPCRIESNVQEFQRAAKDSQQHPIRRESRNHLSCYRVRYLSRGHEDRGRNAWPFDAHQVLVKSGEGW